MVFTDNVLGQFREFPWSSPRIYEERKRKREREREREREKPRQKRVQAAAKKAKKRDADAHPNDRLEAAKQIKDDLAASGVDLAVHDKWVDLHLRLISLAAGRCSRWDRPAA